MRGLEPRIHDEAPQPYVATLPLFVMDCRVKPGNDSGEGCAPKRDGTHAKP
ncbi:MAG: hypothetical protein WB390_09860 [Pseudolabrys sp.]